MPFKLDVKKKLVARSGRVKSTDLHPTEPWVLVSLYEGNVHVWNYETQQLIKTFEVSDSPVRTAKFIPKKNWIVCGTDDFRIVFYNYNTSERIHSIDAHSDYIRSIVVHHIQPYILSSSDDTQIKLWNWDKDFMNIQTFEGHNHYVMQVAINPKDTNTFASASLDQTVRIWQFGSTEANFPLEGHERGVNCIDYYPDKDKPYLISGSDDKTVKIWDYQTRTCVQTLEGHNKNISSVMFHPDLPLILTNSEDSTLRAWNMNSYQLEHTYNYGMDRAWCLSCLKNSNIIAIGYDAGTVVLKLGREEPPVSMDNNGKIVWAKQTQLQQAIIKSLGNKDSTEDGSIASLQVKDMVTCEIYPQTVAHNSNGKFVVVCGDGQYIIHTALTLRNKDFGDADEFVWASDPNMYATRGIHIKVHKFSNPAKTLKLEQGCENIFGGHLLGVTTTYGLEFYDWDTLELIRRIEVFAKNVYWSESKDLICIVTEENFFILKYNQELVTKCRAEKIEPDEDGYEDAFEVLFEVDEIVSTGTWISDCFVFTNNSDKLNYSVGGEVVTVGHLSKPMYILGYLSKENRVYLADKELNVVSYSLPLTVLNYQTAVLREDMESANSILKDIPEEHLTRVAHFLEKQGHKQKALELTQDPSHKFDLAIAINNLSIAYDLAESEESDDKRKQVAELALAECNFNLAKECMKKTKDVTGLLVLATAANEKSICEEALKIAYEENLPNVAFCFEHLLNNRESAIELLSK